MRLYDFIYVACGITCEKLTQKPWHKYAIIELIHYIIGIYFRGIRFSVNLKKFLSSAAAQLYTLNVCVFVYLLLSLSICGYISISNFTIGMELSWWSSLVICVNGWLRMFCCFYCQLSISTRLCTALFSKNRFQKYDLAWVCLSVCSQVKYILINTAQYKNIPVRPFLLFLQTNIHVKFCWKCEFFYWNNEHVHCSVLLLFSTTNNPRLDY